MKRISLLLSLTFALFLIGNALAINENVMDAKSSFSALPTLERPTPSQGTDQYDYDLALTNIGMETGVDWNDCPEFCEYWQFWVKIYNNGYEIVDCAFIIFTINGIEIGREHVAGMYPGEVRKLISPEFHIEWPEKCTEFMIDAHVEWPPDENPENDRIAHIKYVSGHVDECLAYDDGVITNGWTWNPGFEYPDYAMASKWHFDAPGTVVYVEFWLSQVSGYPLPGHVEFFVWAEDPNNPGFPLDNTPEDIIYRNEYQLHPEHYWPDAQYVCFPVCLEVNAGETYFFGYCDRQETIQFLCVDGVEDYPDRNMYKSNSVWCTGPFFGGDWLIRPCLQWELVEVDCPEVELPIFTSLDQNYPNPFNANTNISFDLAEASNVSLNVYDITGRLVVTLVDGQMDAGQHVVVWDASNVSSGVYFYKLSAGDYTFTKKMNLLR